MVICMMNAKQGKGDIRNEGGQVSKGSIILCRMVSKGLSDVFRAETRKKCLLFQIGFQVEKKHIPRVRQDYAWCM